MAKYSRLDFRTALPQIEGDVNVIQEWISSALDFFYPVGTVYETSNANFNPNETWGGTWEKVKGRVLVGFDEDDTDATETFGVVGSQGGSRGAWKHNHTSVENGEHSHGLRVASNVMANGTKAAVYNDGTTVATRAVVSDGSHNHTINDSGSSLNTINVDKANMPPYEVVVIWKRIK